MTKATEVIDGEGDEGYVVCIEGLNNRFGGGGGCGCSALKLEANASQVGPRD
jgi:hypothetical protein